MKYGLNKAPCMACLDTLVCSLEDTINLFDAIHAAMTEGPPDPSDYTSALFAAIQHLRSVAKGFAAEIYTEPDRPL